MARLDRELIRFRPLAERTNRVSADRDMIDPDRAPPPAVLERHGEQLERTAARIIEARKAGASVMVSFGAHAVKNGLGPVLIRLMEEGYVTHLATNGAGIIHDWELSYFGATSEDVGKNLADGSFGNWTETGRFLNLALAVGAYEGLGYGEAVGAFIERGDLRMPSVTALERAAAGGIVPGKETEAAAALALLGILRRHPEPEGPLRADHPWKNLSIQAAAFRAGKAFTGHPMFGHDIIYTHPLNSGIAVGICAERDFLTFADGVANLSGGVYLSIGSAVMSPMIFEKSLSMARNIAGRDDRTIQGFTIQVVDLNETSWDWNVRGEPPQNHPDYYLRFMKTFSRASARDVSCLSMDNRDYLLGLYHALRKMHKDTKIIT